MAEAITRHPACQFQSNKSWLDRRFHQDGTIIKPHELVKDMQDPPQDIIIGDEILDRINGSMIGLTLGDALGAHVEFRPHDYMIKYPVKTLKGGGTWGLDKGQFTDDTSMAICLANSLVARKGFVLYDQLVRYKWWYRNGYMSSTGNCFDIGASTRQSLQQFESRQEEFAEKYQIPLEQLDFLSDQGLLNIFNVNCSEPDVAGNGPLMRLTAVPLFFHHDPILAVEYSGYSAQITHGDRKAIDACRYYSALIVAALGGESREALLDKDFYDKHKEWFGEKKLDSEILNIAKGSYQQASGYDSGIRGKGYIVNALEAALWAFWSNDDDFSKGVLAAINLGDDTDTTAAIYGQLAGAYYGYAKLPDKWVKQIYAKDFIGCLSKWLAYEGERWFLTQTKDQSSITEKTTEEQEQKFTESYSSNKLKPDVYHSSTNQLLSSTKQPIKIYFNDNVDSCEDVRKWIEALNEDYADEASALENYNIDGYWLLNHITNDNLQKYGVQRADHRQSILDSIEELKQRSKVKIISE